MGRDDGAFHQGWARGRCGGINPPPCGGFGEWRDRASADASLKLPAKR